MRSPSCACSMLMERSRGGSRSAHRNPSGGASANPFSIHEYACTLLGFVEASTRRQLSPPFEVEHNTQVRPPRFPALYVGHKGAGIVTIPVNSNKERGHACSLRDASYFLFILTTPSSTRRPCRASQGTVTRQGRKQKSKISPGKHKKGDTAQGDPMLVSQETELMNPSLH